VPLYGHARRVGSHRSVELFAQDVGVAGVPTGLGKQMNEDVEQGHLGVLPPGHAARGIEGEGVHRRVAVVPHASVAADDVAAGLVLRRWQQIASQALVDADGFPQANAERLRSRRATRTVRVLADPCLLRERVAVERVKPPFNADERSTLSGFLDYQRATLLGKAEGLNADQLRRQLPTSKLTLAGLLKHLAFVEDDWIQTDFLGRPAPEPWASAPWDEDRDWEFHSAAQDDPDELRALYLAACNRTRRVVAAHDLDKPAAGTHPSGQHWSLR